jgi:hypothetical protein
MELELVLVFGRGGRERERITIEGTISGFQYFFP